MTSAETATADGVTPDGASSSASLPSAPTADSERVVAVDSLRGFALLGILVMNIQSFAMVSATYMNPTVSGDLSGLDYWVWLFSHLLADMKFMTIFSMLFGAGIVIVADRQTARGRSAASLHYRRMGWLVIFALAHAYLLWYGDILFTYAVCGMLLYPLRRLPPALLLFLGVLMVGVASAISIGFGASMQYWPEQALQEFEADEWSPSAEMLGVEIERYRGSWLDQMPHRALTSFFVQTFVFLILLFWRAGGLMLIGMALWRWDVFSAKRSVGFYTTLVLFGVCGLPLILYGVQRNLAADWDVRYSFFFGNQFNYWGSVMVSIGYVGFVMIACKTSLLPRLMSSLAAVGQMALTNYLLHTLICTTIFYGHGLGQFQRFSRVEQLLLVFAIWVFQLVASPIWLRHFRFGPFEWLWRSLSYWRRQPMRRGASTG